MQLKRSIAEWAFVFPRDWFHIEINAFKSKVVLWCFSRKILAYDVSNEQCVSAFLNHLITYRKDCFPNVSGVNSPLHGETEINTDDSHRSTDYLCESSTSSWSSSSSISCVWTFITWTKAVRYDWSFELLVLLVRIRVRLIIEFLYKIFWK